MMSVIIIGVSGMPNLQATLSAATAGMSDMTHHPITCASHHLWLHEDGRLECEHKTAPSEDPRTRACIDHTIAILLMEELHRREHGSPIDV